MAETTANTGNEAENARNHFSKAMEEARAGAQALADGCLDKINQAKTEWTSEARSRSEDAKGKASAFAADAREKANTYAAEARTKATEVALEGKARTSQAIAGLSKLIDDNIGLIDQNVGAKYGDYARSASQSMKNAASRLDEKSLDELGEDAKEFVRQSPGVAIGMAVVAGFLVGRMFKKSS